MWHRTNVHVNKAVFLEVRVELMKEGKSFSGWVRDQMAKYLEEKAREL